MKIKSASACYTGGGIYVYLGETTDGRLFVADDDSESISIMDSLPESLDDLNEEFFNSHLLAELVDGSYQEFWNSMLHHIIDGNEAYGDWSNFTTGDLQERIIDVQDSLSPRIERVFEIKEGRNWRKTITTTDATDVYKFLTEELIAKKINNCRYIRSIKRENLYNGYQRITVSYADSGRAIYTIRNNF